MTFREFLFEGKEKPYEILGNVRIPLLTAKGKKAGLNIYPNDIAIGLKKFVNSKGYDAPVVVRTPQEHNDGDLSDTEWHKDGSQFNQPEKLGVWATQKPTLLFKHKNAIKPFDVAVIHNTKVSHKRPVGSEGSDRHFARFWDIRKYKGLQESTKGANPYQRGLNRPYRKLGKFFPSKYDSDTIKQELGTFLKNTPYEPIDIGDKYEGKTVVRNPESNVRLSQIASNTNWHQDAEFANNSKNLHNIIWSTSKPTRIRKHHPDRQGKRIGGDIQSHDVVAVLDSKTIHAMPKNIKAEDNRWFASALAKKIHKKKHDK